MSHLKERAASAILRALRSASSSARFLNDWMFTSGANFLPFLSLACASIVARGKVQLRLRAAESAPLVLGFTS
jgi:hypothetical protein